MANIVVGIAVVAFVAVPTTAIASSSGTAVQQVDTIPLTLPAAVAEAVESYPSVIAAHARYRAERAGVVEAEAERVPRVDLNADVTRFEEPMLVSPLHELDPEAAEFENLLVQADISARYMVFGGARGARIDRARALARAAGARVDSVVAGLTEQTARTYLSVVAGRARVAARNQQVEAITEEVERAREFFTVGRAARLEVLRAEAELATARAETVSAARGHDLAERELARLMGASTSRAREGRLAACRVQFPHPLEREALVAAALAADPVVAEARFRADAAAASAEEERASRWPEVAVAGRYIEYGSDRGHFTGEWQVGVELSVPIFTGGARSARIERAEAEAREARARLDLAELHAAAAVDTALADLQEARARQEAFAAAVVHFEELSRVELAALRTGRGTQSDYLTALADLAESRAELARTQGNAVAAQLALARAIGQLAPAWTERYVECGP